jgi:hypothetical protein
MMRNKLLFPFLFFLSLSLTPLWADDSSLFTRRDLRVDGEIVGKMNEDVNGDSLIDILVFYKEGEDENLKRMVGYFKQQTGSVFDTIPNQVFELDKKASVVDLADIDKDKRKELLFLAEDGVYYYSLEGESFNHKPALLLSTTCFLSSPEEKVMIWDFCPELKNKNEMVMIPQKKGYDILTKKEQNNFVFQSKLGFKPDISLYGSSGELDQNRGLIHLSYEIPSMIFTDYDQDGKEDVLLLNKDKMYVFLSKADGSFQEQADKVVALKARGNEEKQEVKIDDVNGDGLIDLILNESTGDLEKGGKTKINIYLGKKGEGFHLDSPHQILSSEKEQSEVWFNDLDKDGKKEMIMTSWGFSVGSFVKLLFSKSAKFNLYIRSLRENDTYPNQPNREMKLSVKVSLGSSSDDNQALDFSGDFNGDGLNDFYFVGGENIMKFYLGRKGDFFADKPQHEMGIDIPAGGPKIIDLNNDGKSDLIFSPEKKELKGKITILFSKM